MKNFDLTVNGLRAVAVMLVIAFHYGMPFVSGGFIGVDVFFVISGYVITLSIYEKIKEKRFSILGYFRSRFFRIFPALLVVSFLTLCGSAYVLFPTEALRSAWHAVSSILFVSNFVFKEEVGYFDVENEFKPFLHTWSLAVEWQFYIFWPIALFVLGFFKKFSSYVLIFFITAGILVSGLMSHHSNFVFYMMPLRGWEFALGGLIALIPSEKSIRQGLPIMSVFGVIGILMSAILYDDDTVFPGFSAALPCLSAFSLLFFNRKYTEPLLSTKPFQYLGTISYSLYLYHWPIYVLYKNNVLRELVLVDFVVILFVVLICSHLSYQFVEQPFRKRDQGHKKIKLIILLILTALCAAVSWFVIKTDGKAERYNESEQALIDYFEREHEAYRKEYGVYYPANPDEKWAVEKHLNIPCLYDNYLPKSPNDSKIIDCAVSNNEHHADKHGRYLVIGDSNGKNVYEALVLAFPDKGFSLLMHSGCVAVEDENCFPFFQDQIRSIFEKTKINGVILSSRYSNQSVSAMDSTVMFLKDMNMPFLIVGATPTWRQLPVMVMLHKGVDLDDKVFNVPLSATLFHDDIFENDKILEKIAKTHDGFFWEKKAVLCPENICNLVREDYDNPLYLDMHHVSKEGLDVLMKAMRDSSVFINFFDNED